MRVVAGRSGGQLNYKYQSLTSEWSRIDLPLSVVSEQLSTLALHLLSTKIWIGQGKASRQTSAYGAFKWSPCRFPQAMWLAMAEAGEEQRIS